MGAIVKNKLSFEIVDLQNCTLLGILDTSTYSVDSDLIESPTIQLILPDTPSGSIVELNYYPEEVTLFNSNTLGLTSVSDPVDYTALPDGLWTIKMTICPFEDNWYQKQFYRTCQLECKFYKAFLNLEINKCESCYNDEKAKKLNKAWMYIQGLKANVADCNFRQATRLYSVSEKLLDDLIECDC